MPPDEWSPAVADLVQESFEGVKASQLLDIHCHVVGTGEGNSGCWVSPELTSHLNPVRRVKFEAYLEGSGMQLNSSLDDRYLRRLKQMMAPFPSGARVACLAFDWSRSSDGTIDREATTFHVPNDHVLGAAKNSARFTPFASVHPFAPDALTELARVASLGATGIKWLPNAMSFDPSDPRCDAFYEQLQKLGLVLLSHTGRERAVHAEHAQEFGNPLRLRRALEHGVTVVAAHCASLGNNIDLDRGQESTVRAPSFELFLRMLSEPRWEGRFFGDLSAMTLVNRNVSCLDTLLSRPGFHSRLINGSDYPVMAIDPLVNHGELADAGLLQEADIPALRELFEANPLLWDFVLKRRLRSSSLGSGFSHDCFEGGRLLRINT